MSEEGTTHPANVNFETVPPYCRVALATLHMLDAIDNPTRMFPAEPHHDGKLGRDLLPQEAELRLSAIECVNTYLRLHTPKIVQVTHPMAVRQWIPQ